MNISQAIIESKDNKRYKELLKLKKGNKEECLFLVQGEDLVEEAKRSEKLKELIVMEDDEVPCHLSSVPTIRLKRELYRELAEFQSLPKFMGVAKNSLQTIDMAGDSVIYLDGVQDPGNCGTIIRTALAFGYSAVALSQDSVSPFNSKVVQSTKGALFHLPLIKEDLKPFFERGYHIYLTALEGVDERTISKLEAPFVLVFGNEGRGVKKENLKLGKSLRIEMSGIDSLNVGVAAGIFMYRFRKE